MEITILAFGQITDITGKSNMKLSGIADTDELVKMLGNQFPTLRTVEYSIAVNKKIIHKNRLLEDRDVVALLPPFSGG